MTTMTLGGVRAAARAPAGHGLLALLSREWSYFQARRSLAAFDDALLGDIGVSRGQIGDAVRHGRSALRRG